MIIMFGDFYAIKCLCLLLFCAAQLEGIAGELADPREEDIITPPDTVGNGTKPTTVTFPTTETTEETESTMSEGNLTTPLPLPPSCRATVINNCFILLSPGCLNCITSCAEINPPVNISNINSDASSASCLPCPPGDSNTSSSGKFGILPIHGCLPCGNDSKQSNDNAIAISKITGIISSSLPARNDLSDSSDFNNEELVNVVKKLMKKKKLLQSVIREIQKEEKEENLVTPKPSVTPSHRPTKPTIPTTKAPKTTRKPTTRKPNHPKPTESSDGPGLSVIAIKPPGTDSDYEGIEMDGSDSAYDTFFPFPPPHHHHHHSEENSDAIHTSDEHSHSESEEHDSSSEEIHHHEEGEPPENIVSTRKFLYMKHFVETLLNYSDREAEYFLQLLLKSPVIQRAIVNQSFKSSSEILDRAMFDDFELKDSVSGDLARAMLTDLVKSLAVPPETK